MLISMINGVTVKQIDSSVSVSHNNKQSHKIGVQAGTLRLGARNINIDLGQGLKKYSVTVEVDGVENNYLLTSILDRQRLCSFVDKWTGVFDAYILGYTKKNSDKHIGVTIYSIDFAKQDGSNMLNFVEHLIDDIINLVVGTIGEYINMLTIVDTRTKRDYTQRKDIFLYNPLNAIANSLYLIFPMRKNEFKHYVKNIGLYKDDIIENVKQEKRRELSIEYIESEVLKSNIEQIEMQDYTTALRVAEGYKLITELNALKDKNFNNMYEFDKFVDKVMGRMGNLQMREQIDNVISYALEQKYRRIVYIYANGENIYEILFEKYGNLELLDDIRRLNGLQNTDSIVGEFKIYELDS